MNAVTMPTEIADFASAVRAALADLPPDEIDDLTDGLDADLLERADESGLDDLGDPAAYAEELRAAAGIPRRAPIAPAARPSVWEELKAVPSQIASETRALARRHPALAGLGSFFSAIRPLWWLLRGVTVYLVLMVLTGLPQHALYFGQILLLTACVVTSVQWGRGRWLPWSWMRPALVVVSVLAVLVSPLILAWTIGLGASYSTSSYADAEPDYSTDGLTDNGKQVTNIYAFDANGQPLTNVRLYDQSGKPLTPMSSPQETPSLQTETNRVLVPSELSAGSNGWNVYPLDHVAASQLRDDGKVSPTATRIPSTLPFTSIAPLASVPVPNSDGASASPTATPTPSASPSAAPTPTPSPGG